jgi:isopentenyldiphosphate isomerase
MREELFEVIDESGKVVGTEKRSVVHEKGFLHKSVDVFVLDEGGQIFIQQRSFDKDVGPGLWDLSAAEHLKPGESFEEAAARGVREELGVKAIGLKKIGEADFHFKRGKIIDNEKKVIFRCSFRGKIRLQKEEIEQGKWVSKKELLQEMQEKPEKFTEWLLGDRRFVELL